MCPRARVPEGGEEVWLGSQSLMMMELWTEIDRKTETERSGESETTIDRWPDRQTGRRRERERESQTDRERETETEKQSADVSA